MTNEVERHEVGIPIPESVRAAVVRGLQEGFGMMSLSRQLGVSHHAIEEIRESNADKLPDWRATTKCKLKSFISLSGERLTSEVMDIPIATLPVAFAIAVDKLLLLEGEATVRVEHTHRVEPGRFAGWMAQIIAPTPHQLTIDAQVVEPQASLACPKPEQTIANPGEGAKLPGGG